MYLYGLQKFGMKFGLRNIRELLRYAGDPHKKFPSVHVAGTNGKGSTSSLIAAALTAAGYRVGLYTSPHIVRFNERIRINGAMISGDDLSRFADVFRRKIDVLNATFFEATTAIAFTYFAEEKIDIGVIETGLGGRLDATNVLTPVVSVITSIGRDHTEHLGSTLREIAREKGGIIKQGIECVTGVGAGPALRELKKIARRRDARLIQVEVVTTLEYAETRIRRQIFSISTLKNRFEGLIVPLLGDHQLQNACTALVTLEQLQSKGYDVPQPCIRSGFRAVLQLTGIRGRFEILRSRPKVVLDVAHNPDGVAAVVHALGGIRYGQVHLVFGVMRDKDYRQMIRTLSGLQPIVYAVCPSLERALPAATIAKVFERMQCRARSYRSVSRGVRAALHAQRAGDLVLVCGSHYVAGEALPVVEEAIPRNSS